MKTFKSITILLLLIATKTVFGQATSDKEIEKPYIEVTGTAEKEIIPNEIYITITIRERQEGKEKITIDKQEADLKEALKSIGVSLDNLSLSDANANYIRVKWTKKDVITKNEYVLKVGDALTIGKVFEKLDELKIVEANISRVSHSKLEEFKKEVRIMAIKAAKEKADYLLTAIGEQTGKALKVYEQSPSYKIDDAYLNVRGGRSESSIYYVDGIKMSESDKDKILQFQKIKLQSAIYVKFEIK
ncbi:MAG: SIMPL domain-containing protein [Bacteroidia bacterium]|nr:SIMPL domain-containing protein [Bacteroidia bacterium]